MIYYFNGSDAVATDPQSVWTNDANAFDGSITTNANSTTSGDASSNFLKAEGTDAPTEGKSILQVKVRLYGLVAGGYPSITANVYTDALAELLGSCNSTSTVEGWGNFTILSVPSGGWTWQKIKNLEVKIFGASGTSYTIYRVEIDVTVSHDAFSNYNKYIQVGDGMSRSN